MADDYADLVELGFEGLDRGTDKFHDPVVNFAKKHAPRLSPGGKHAHKKDSHPDRAGQGHSHRDDPDHDRSHRDRSRQRRSPHDRSEQDDSMQDRSDWDRPDQSRYYQDLPPPPPGPPPGFAPPPGAVPPPSFVPPPQEPSHQRQRRDRYDYSDSESESDRDDRRRRTRARGHTSGRRNDWRDDGYADENAYGYNAPSSDRGYQSERDDQSTRGRNGPGMAGAMTRQGPPYQYDPAAVGAMAAAGRPQPSRRGSSWSPPRKADRESRDRRRNESPHRALSKSPNSKYRAAAVIMGAVAGGVAGSRFQRKQPVANSVSTVLGAIVGGLGAREAEQAWDKRKGKSRMEGSQRRGDEDGRDDRDSRNGRDERRERRRERDYD